MQAEPRVAVKVWDLPVRLFHWIVVVLLAVQAVTGKLGGEWMTLHAWGGYAFVVAIVYRVTWGFVGGTHARFASFLAGPRAALRFARRLFSREAVPQLGHNPLGGWNVIAILAVIALQAGTGLFANDGAGHQGPLGPLVSAELSAQLTRIHRWNFDALLALSAVHVLAVLFHWLVKKEDLIGAMVTGVKRVPASMVRERREVGRGAPLRRVASRESSAFTFVSARRGFAVLALSLFLVWALLGLAP